MVTNKMNRIIDSLILALGALTLIVFMVAVLHSEQVIHLSDPIRQAMGAYGRASVVVAFLISIALIIQRVKDLRSRRQKWEKLSRSLESSGENPANR